MDKGVYADVSYPNPKSEEVILPVYISCTMNDRSGLEQDICEHVVKAVQKIRTERNIMTYVNNESVVFFSDDPSSAQYQMSRLNAHAYLRDKIDITNAHIAVFVLSPVEGKQSFNVGVEYGWTCDETFRLVILTRQNATQPLLMMGSDACMYWTHESPTQECFKRLIMVLARACRDRLCLPSEESANMVRIPPRSVPFRFSAPREIAPSQFTFQSGGGGVDEPDVSNSGTVLPDRKEAIVWGEAKEGEELGWSKY